MNSNERRAPDLRGIWTGKAQQTARPTGSFFKSMFGGLAPAALRRMTQPLGTHTQLEKSNG